MYQQRSHENGAFLYFHRTFSKRDALGTVLELVDLRILTKNLPQSLLHPEKQGEERPALSKTTLSAGPTAKIPAAFHGSASQADLAAGSLLPIIRNYLFSFFWIHNILNVRFGH